MNDKQNHLYRIVDIVVDCCSMEVDGIQTITREDVLGESRAENVNMTRCILAMLLIGKGFSVTTISMLMHRQPRTVRDMLKKGHDYHMTSEAFRVASAQATLKCRGLIIDNV